MTRAVLQTRSRVVPRMDPLGNGIRGTREVVRSRLDVKSWTEKPPSADEVRPAQCPCCGAASRPMGGRLVLHGHGRRERQLRGPLAPGEPPVVRLFFVRRYRCTRCRALTTVAPAETVSRRLFSGPAIALALALFGVMGLCLPAVRKHVSPWAVVGPTAATGWGTVERWVDAARAGALFPCVRRVPPGWTDRQVAERVATTLAALAPLGTGPPDIATCAFLGAARAG